MVGLVYSAYYNSLSTNHLHGKEAVLTAEMVSSGKFEWCQNRRNPLHACLAIQLAICFCNCKAIQLYSSKYFSNVLSHVLFDLNGIHGV